MGTYAMTTGTLTVVGGNYTISSFVPANLSITVKPITVTAIAASKVFGASDPVFTYTSSDASTTFSGTLSRVAGESVGTYAMTTGTLTVVGGNYTISSFVPANLSITVKPITVTAIAASKVFGASDPTFTYTSSDASTA